MKQNTWKLIDNQADLIELCKDIKSWERPLPLDLEADSMHCYHAKICLVQITLNEQDYIIDPFKFDDLSLLLDALEEKTLIIHGSDYDIRMMRDNWNFAPKKVFDTMIASRYIGEKQFGLASIILKHFNVELDKTSQKADWSRRPLPQQMLDYAALDTHYLIELYDIQMKQLEDLDRVEWLEEHCQHLLDQVSSETPTVDTERWRVKGSSLINRKQLAILKEIWNWRESRAQQKDQPPYKVLANEKAIHIAKVASSAAKMNLNRLGRMPKNLNEKALEALVENINKALKLSPEEYPEKKRRSAPQTPSPHPVIMESLKQYREEKGAEYQIDEALLANRNQLVHLALNLPRHPADMGSVYLMKWQWNFWQPKIETLRAL